jgi:DNA topoisomerase III
MLEGSTTPRAKRKRDSRRKGRAGSSPEMPSELPRLFEDLRAWRLEQARKTGVPAFRILSDRVLLAICEAMPSTEDQLTSVPGVGSKIVKKYGPDLLQYVEKTRG